VQPNPATAEDPRSVLRHACAELERRLRAGEDCRAEQFLDAYPVLAADPDSALELVRAEWLVRKALGQAGSLEEWLSRFPQWREPLQRWLDQDRNPGTTADGVRTLPDRGEHQPAAPATGQSLDDHEILGELGHGGMGVVYRAWDPTLKRAVALKKIRAGVLATPDQVGRFYREARAAAQLAHPNIVAVYSMGLHHGEHCFTMELVAGGSLDKHGKLFQDDTRTAVHLVEQVTRAVQHAHAADIVHRDLKPANILLASGGCQSPGTSTDRGLHKIPRSPGPTEDSSPPFVSWTPKVSDFGLAKIADAGDMSSSGQLMGTPAYMAPEQAAGRSWDVGPRTDVWAVGVILYELLVARRPFESERTEELLRLVQHEAPSPPRALRPDLDPGLEAVVLKCLEKEPTDRYPTAEALGDDLRRWLRGEAPTARPVGRLTRLGRTLRRHRLVVVVALIVAVVAFLVAFWLSRPAPPDPDQAVKDVEERLAAGHAVELVGETGLPPWHRWRVGAGGLAVPPGEGQPLSMETWGYGLVELVRSPRRDSYRIRAEVQLDPFNPGEFGLAFLYHEQNTAKGTESSFATLTLDSRGPQAVSVELNLRRHLPPREHAKSAGIRKLVAGKAQDWHRLVVEVRSGSIRAYLDDALLGELGPAALARSTADLRDAAAPAGTEPVFDRQGGLGLFLYRGAASVRRIVVEPLK
jgi:hypothetical protein